ncbi:MAG: CAP domain-containing protein [Thermoleophilaceae bacterium]|jgi:uncharacterized protein YkwD
MISRTLRLAAPLALVLGIAFAGPAAQAAVTSPLAQALNAGRAVQKLPALPAAKVGATPQAKMFQAINGARARNGLSQVSISRSLTVASTRYARVLGSRHLFQHARQIRTSRAFSLVGEILARSPGRNPSIDPVVSAWLQSPVHRPILLGSEFQAVGLGMTQAKYDGQWWTVWVVRFGKR